MDEREAKKGEVERLAELRAKRRVGSWSEQFKSPWQAWFWFIVVFGLIALFFMWASDASIGLMILIGFLLAVLAWFLYYKHNNWEQKQFHKFYEEELLELKVKK